MSNIKENNLLYQGSIPKAKRNAGCIKGKKEIRIDGRTVAYVDPKKSKSDCEKIKKRYLDHMRIYV